MIYFVSVWLHVLAAAVWLGSMVFFAVVVVPTLRSTALASVAPRAIKELARVIDASGGRRSRS